MHTGALYQYTAGERRYVLVLQMCVLTLPVKRKQKENSYNTNVLRSRS